MTKTIENQLLSEIKDFTIALTPLNDVFTEDEIFDSLANLLATDLFNQNSDNSNN